MLFAAVHGFSFFGGFVGGAVEVVDAVGDIKGEFEVGVAALGAFVVGALDVDDEVAGKLVGFAGDGVVAEADDVGGVVFGEVLLVVLGDAGVVGEEEGDLFPGGLGE